MSIGWAVGLFVAGELWGYACGYLRGSGQAGETR